MSDYRLIPLSGKRGNGKFVKVSPEDYDCFNTGHKFCLDTNGYAMRGFQKDGKTQALYIHKEVAKRMGLPTSVRGIRHVDHEDRDRLNNTRENLRMASPGQNVMNVGLKANNTVGFTGVCLRKDLNGYEAFISINRNQTSVGPFATAREAALVRDALVRYYYGEFGVTNFEGSEAYDILCARSLLRSKRNRTSQFRNVTWFEEMNCWKAEFQFQKKRVYLGLFGEEREAAEAVNQARIDRGLRPLNIF